MSLIADNPLLAPAYMTYSDRRGKQDITDLAPDEAISWVKQGRARKYTVMGRPQAGFLAQEDLENGRSEAVLSLRSDDPLYAEGDGHAEPKHRLIRDYQQDIAYLTAALQAALTKIEDLTGRLTLLEAKIAP